MAGFFGLFNYEKEGPGIEKDAPKKKAIFVFVETFFRNLWKFMPISFVYSLLSLPQVTGGLASAGITHVARQTARDKHSFGLSDFFDTIKKNWKQGLVTGIINTLAYILMFFDIYFFWSMEKGTFSTLCLAFSFCILFIFTIMQFFIPTMIITFKFTIKQIYKNAYKFVFINFKNNLICFFSIVLSLAVYFVVIYLLQSYWYIVLPIELIIYAITFPGYKYLLIQYCVFPAIKKYIIDPYYKEHPDEDIDKRRDLGIEIEEEKTEEEEKEETEED